MTRECKPRLRRMKGREVRLTRDNPEKKRAISMLLHIKTTSDRECRPKENVIRAEARKIRSKRK